MAFARGRIRRRIFLSRSGSVATGRCVQIRDERHRADVADFWISACSRFYLSPCWRIGRTRPTSGFVGRNCVFNRRSGGERDHVRRNLGTNEKSVRAHAHPRCWRSSAELRQLRPDVVLKADDNDYRFARNHRACLPINRLNVRRFRACSQLSTINYQLVSIEKPAGLTFRPRRGPR